VQIARFSKQIELGLLERFGVPSAVVHDGDPVFFFGNASGKHTPFPSLSRSSHPGKVDNKGGGSVWGRGKEPLYYDVIFAFIIVTG
jgi:hypothetical protein